MLKIVVLASGNGSNLQSIIDTVEKGGLRCEIAAVISDRGKAYALERAKKHGVKDIHIKPEDFASREDFDAKLVEVINGLSPDLIVLAGFMRILSPVFVRAFPNKILNIHPALLPKYPGIHSIERAFEAKDKVTGVTVHFIDEGVDTGPIVKQVEVPINKEDNLDELEDRVHKAEHKLYVEVLKLYSEGKVKVEGRKVIIK